MARKKSPSSRPAPQSTERGAVTFDRFQRLCRLLYLLANKPQTREVLSRKLRVDVRGFYRDLEVLRAVDVPVSLDRSRYSLEEPLPVALDRLPFPDPGLSLGEARILARGRSAVHRKLKTLIDSAMPG